MIGSYVQVEYLCSSIMIALSDKPPNPFSANSMALKELKCKKFYSKQKF